MRTLVMVLFVLATPAMAADWRDPSPHAVKVIRVTTGAQLEVLDWGGKGTPIVLLAGLGCTAHTFDDFAPKLRTNGHIYGITRRGFGASRPTSAGYSTDELSADVMGAIDALKLKNPVVVGHSVAGVELNALGAKFGDRLGGLIYLDPAIEFDKEDQELLGVSKWGADISTLRGDLSALEHEGFDTTPHIRRLLDSSWPALEADLKLLLRSQPAIDAASYRPPTEADLSSYASLGEYYRRVRGINRPEADLRATIDFDPATHLLTRKFTPPEVENSIQAGTQHRSGVSVRALAVFALRDTPVANASPDSVAALTEVWTLRTRRRIDALTRDVRGLRTVSISHADHYVYLSNESAVLRAIAQFLH